MKGLVKETAVNGVPVFPKVLETATGGFTLSDSAFASGVEIEAGTVIGADETTRLAKVAKMGVLQAGVSNSVTAYPVLKGHNFAVGMSINLSGGTSRAITSITDNTTYDTLNVATTIGVAGATGDAIYVDDDGYNKAIGCLYLPVIVPSVGNADLAVVRRGTVYENRIQSIPTAMKTKLPNMIFSKSY